VELIKELNKMLGIEMKLSTSFHPQTDSQTERMNQKLEQYLQFFVDCRQKDQPEWLATAKFAANNKIYSATKISLFIVNYGRELRIKADIKRKGQVKKAMEFVKRIKVQEKVGVALKKAQEEMKQQVDRGRKEIEE